MVESWMVTRTRTRQELWARENATRQGFECYLPLLLRKVRNPNLLMPAPVFPSYLFIRNSLDQQWQRLLGTFGIQGVVRFGGKPATISDKVIAQLRQREDAQGLVQLPQPFAPGEKATIQRGPFQGQTGICAGMAPYERQRVLLDFLGRKVEVLVRTDDLQQAA